MGGCACGGNDVWNTLGKSLSAPRALREGSPQMNQTGGLNKGTSYFTAYGNNILYLILNRPIIYRKEKKKGVV